jgi:hypothetical protein
VLNIFINVIYDENPQYNSYYPNNENWLEATQEGVNNEAIPDYLLDLLDTVYNPNSTHGYMTRLYGESSFDSLQIIGDYVVVNVNESRVINTYGNFSKFNIGKAAIDVININGLQTIYGHNSMEDYKYGNNNKIYFTQFFIRNINKEYGGLDCGQGYGGSCMNNKMIRIGNDSIPISHLGTFQCVGVNNFANNPTSIVSHEFSHNLFGGNEFHTSGGNHRGSFELMPFFSVQGGYGLMGAYGSSLVSCNGYERWRLNWKHPSTPYLIGARDSLNLTNQNSDISQSDGVVTFILRDFVTTGDAIRIKLPYKDSEHASNQYIWLENHQVGKNSKVDFYQYSNTHSCRPQGLAGIYAYYQVGRDIRSGNGANFNQTNERDNLKVIPAEGYWDYITIQDNYTHECVGSGSFEYSNVRYSENPFCGTHDQEDQFFPPSTDNTLKFNHIKEMWRKEIGESVNDSLPRLGDNLDAFHSYSKINMGTNPSTCNTKTFYNALMKDNTLYLGDANRNNQTTYLTGLSIEMIPLPDSTYRVNIRWDDYTVKNDAIWTGNICLKEFLYLNSGKTIHLKQNKTVALPHRNPETGYFANFTHFKCDSNSVFVLNNNSELKIDEKSIFEIDTLATFIVSDSSLLHITGGSSLSLKKGGDFKIYGTGTVIIDSLSTMIINDTIFASNLANIIVKPGGKLILDNGVITNLNNGEPWKGIRLEGNKNYGQNGAIAKQGTVIVKNYSTISNAICGIKVGDLSDTLVNGGIVFANNSTFKNCKNAVIFAPYKNMDGSLELANRSKFTNCNFIVNDNFYTSELVFDAHVKLFGVNGISFTGCRFTYDIPSLQSDTCYGIDALNSGFTVQPKCSLDPFIGEICNSSNIEFASSFTGFDFGIKAQNGDGFFKVSVLSTNFDSNDYGIYLSGVNNAKILKNRFIIGKDNNLVLNPVGLYIQNGSGYRIEENQFENNFVSNSEKIGLNIKNSGTENNQVYKNQFNNLTYGQIFDGRNCTFTRPYKGLVSLCNKNIDNIGTLKTYLTELMFIPLNQIN